MLIHFLNKHFVLYLNFRIRPVRKLSTACIAQMKRESKMRKPYTINFKNPNNEMQILI